MVLCVVQSVVLSARGFVVIFCCCCCCYCGTAALTAGEFIRLVVVLFELSPPRGPIIPDAGWLAHMKRKSTVTSDLAGLST